MLYIFDGIDLQNERLYDDMLPFLSVQRLEKVNRLRSEITKRASLTVFMLLRLALWQIHGINEAVEFEFGEFEKPRLMNHPDIFFSLSHSGNVAACAVSSNNIGVDVQKVKPIKNKLAKRVLTGEEYSIFLNSPKPDDYFCEIWTVKESFLKKSGDGLTKELREISARNVTGINTIRGPEYYCSVCGGNGDEVNGGDRGEIKGSNSDVNIIVKHVGGDDFEQFFGQTNKRLV